MEGRSAVGSRRRGKSRLTSHHCPFFGLPINNHAEMARRTKKEGVANAKLEVERAVGRSAVRLEPLGFIFLTVLRKSREGSADELGRAERRLCSRMGMSCFLRWSELVLEAGKDLCSERDVSNGSVADGGSGAGRLGAPKLAVPSDVSAEHVANVVQQLGTAKETADIHVQHNSARALKWCQLTTL